MKNAVPRVIVCVGALFGAFSGLAADEAFRFYRFKVDATAGDGLQLSEVRLFSGTTDVTRAAVRLHYDATTRANPKFVFRKGFEPEKAFDGDLRTKWYDDRAGVAKTRDAVWVTLEYAQPVRVTRYEWCTADKTPKFRIAVPSPGASRGRRTTWPGRISTP